MLKIDLAKELRLRQYKYGQVDRELIDAISDDQIIDSYITCSCCGEKQVEIEQLPQIIADAKDTEHFFRICDTMAKTKSHVNSSIEGILKEKEF